MKSPLSDNEIIADDKLCVFCDKPAEDHYYDILINRLCCRFGGVIAVICSFTTVKELKKIDDEL